MPHQCVRCNTFYEDGANEIITGCKCGARLFFYIKKEKLEEAKKLAESIKLSESEKKEIEKDVYEMVGSSMESDEPVILDFESIRVLKPGQYELDLVSMFKDEPLIFRLEDGKYMIDIAETFKSVAEKKKKQKGKK
jgi:predicted  nucleic acid-binding Zn-ribbon protein